LIHFGSEECPNWESAAEPILAEIMREYNVNFNILQGEIETIQDTIVGRMIIQLEANEDQFQQIAKSFLNKNINVEILGYGPRIY
jgi:D-methionine transport system ATP-binding protein